MGIGHSPRAITDGLVFYFDASSRAKSFIGAPSTNYAHFQNPRLDATYSSYVNTQSGTWAAKHSDAITVYNLSGGNISNYVNSGVGDYTNTYHAIWTLDPILRRPVITMRDFDGQWKAKSFATDLNGGSSLQTLGLGVGDKYTISWLQWTDNLLKQADVGVYCRNSADQASFHDGRSYGSITARNTEVGKWERVYHTFTINANRDITKNYDLIFMYGHTTGGRATVKIADLQYELLPYPTGFDYNQTRSNTQAFVDITRNATCSASNLTYAADGSFSFNGSSDYIRFNNSTSLDTQTPTVEVWVRTNSLNQNGFWFEKGTVNSQYALFQEGTSIRWRMNIGGITNLSATTASYMNTSDWFHVVGTYSSGTRILYINGVQVASDTQTGTIATNSGGMTIGEYGGGAYRYNGSIGVVKVYNRALSAEEVKQNFNALRGRYGV